MIVCILFFQIYEFLLYCTQHSDHNVLTATLETLQQLLRTPPPPLLEMLLSADGLPNKLIFPAEEDKGKNDDEEDETSATSGKHSICM